MAELADANWVRVFAYLLVAGCTLAARQRERNRANDVDGVWPTFWLLTAALLVAMAIGRLGDVGNLLADLGRSQASDSGWYADRRPLQAAVVGAVATTWLVFVAVAVWRVPERRRRYLPMSIVAVTLVAYAAMRLVSLHHVDAVLYHRELSGVRWGTVVELSFLAVGAGTTLWVPPARSVAAAGDNPSFRRVETPTLGHPTSR